MSEGTQRTNPISSGKLMSDLDANGHNIRNLDTPIEDGDAATKKYVDDHEVTHPVTSVNNKTGAVVLTGADIAVSGSDATKINAALSGKLDKTDVVSPDSSDVIKSGKAADSGWVQNSRVKAYVEDTRKLTIDGEVFDCVNDSTYVWSNGIFRDEATVDEDKESISVSYAYLYKGEWDVTGGESYDLIDGKWIKGSDESEVNIAFSGSKSYKTDTAPKAAELTPAGTQSLFSSDGFSQAVDARIEAKGSGIKMDDGGPYVEI